MPRTPKPGMTTSLYLTPVEKKRLEWLVKEYGINKSAVIKKLLLEAYIISSYAKKPPNEKRIKELRKLLKIGD